MSELDFKQQSAFRYGKSYRMAIELAIKLAEGKTVGIVTYKPEPKDNYMITLLEKWGFILETTVEQLRDTEIYTISLKMKGFNYNEN